jgi:hypothetical protein
VKHGLVRCPRRLARLQFLSIRGGRRLRARMGLLRVSAPRLQRSRSICDGMRPVLRRVRCADVCSRRPHILWDASAQRTLRRRPGTRDTNVRVVEGIVSDSTPRATSGALHPSSVGCRGPCGRRVRCG